MSQAGNMDTAVKVFKTSIAWAQQHLTLGSLLQLVAALVWSQAEIVAWAGLYALPTSFQTGDRLPPRKRHADIQWLPVMCSRAGMQQQLQVGQTPLQDNKAICCKSDCV